MATMPFFAFAAITRLSFIVLWVPMLALGVVKALALGYVLCVCALMHRLILDVKEVALLTSLLLVADSKLTE